MCEIFIMNGYISKSYTTTKNAIVSTITSNIIGDDLLLVKSLSVKMATKF